MRTTSWGLLLCVVAINAEALSVPPVQDQECGSYPSRGESAAGATRKIEREQALPRVITEYSKPEVLADGTKRVRVRMHMQPAPSKPLKRVGESNPCSSWGAGQ